MATLDLDELWWLFWCEADRHNRVRIDQTRWAKQFGVGKMVLSRAVTALKEKGALTPVKDRGGSASIVYNVAPPT